MTNVLQLPYIGLTRSWWSSKFQQIVWGVWPERDAECRCSVPQERVSEVAELQTCLYMLVKTFSCTYFVCFNIIPIKWLNEPLFWHLIGIQWLSLTFLLKRMKKKIVNKISIHLIQNMSKTNNVNICQRQLNK